MKTALYIALILIISLLTYLGFYNAFYSPKISIQEEGNEIIVFKHEKAMLHLTDSVMKTVFNELYEKNGIVVTKGFTYFYQNPSNRKDIPIEFDSGCMVNDEDSVRLNQISSEFKIQRLPKMQYLVTDFPLKGKMSILFGNLKVYPKLDQYCQDNGFSTIAPVIEIYDRQTKKIHYRRQLEKR